MRRRPDQPLPFQLAQPEAADDLAGHPSSATEGAKEHSSTARPGWGDTGSACRTHLESLGMTVRGSLDVADVV